MKDHLFQTLSPRIADNIRLRIPQREAFAAIDMHYGTEEAGQDREVGVVLPVGCGKSGLLAIGS